jgi:hypothetical protein
MANFINQIKQNYAIFLDIFSSRAIQVLFPAPEGVVALRKSAAAPFV